MRITYHGHACFTVESEGYSLVLDPYKGVEGFPDSSLSANGVLCSHGHWDHCYTDGVRILKAAASGAPSFGPFAVTTLATFHDECGGAKRGANTVHILEAEGKKVVHLGDLGHLLTEEDAEKINGCDVLMIPVGGFFTIGPEEAVQIIRQVNPERIIPMHYRDGAYGLRQIQPLEAFLKLAEEEFGSKWMLLRGYGKTAEL